MPAVRRKIDPADARIVDRGDHFRRIVGASVADDEQLEIGEGLPQRAPDRVRQDGAPVVGGHYHRHARHRRTSCNGAQSEVASVRDFRMVAKRHALESMERSDPRN